MSAPIVTQILTNARSLISNPEKWTQCHLALTATGESCDPWDARADKFCAYGALLRVALDLVSNDYRAAQRFAGSATAALLYSGENPGECFPEGLFAINDYRGHAAVIDLFDRALAA